MAEIGNFEVQIDLWQLLTKFRLVLPAVTISQPKIVLEKNADGSANWEFSSAPAATGAVVPQERAGFPVIEKLVIQDGMLSFDNRETKTQIELKVSEAEGAGFLEQPVKLKAQGTYQKLPITITLDGGSYENLRSSNMPYPLRIDLGAGKLKAKIDGNLTEPMEMKGEEERPTGYSRRRHGAALFAYSPRVSDNAALSAQGSFKARGQCLVVREFFGTGRR